MSLISFNVPDNSDQLSAINGHLADILEELQHIGFDIRGVRKALERIANSAEVIAGIRTREEVFLDEIIENKIEDVRIMTEFGNEDADEEEEKLHKLCDLRDRYAKDREDMMLKLCKEANR